MHPRHYYSIAINYRKTELEQTMLMNLHKKNWVDGLTLRDYEHHCNLNRETVGEMLKLAKDYDKSLEEEEKMTAEQLEIKNVGKVIFHSSPLVLLHSGPLALPLILFSAD